MNKRESTDAGFLELGRIYHITLPTTSASARSQEIQWARTTWTISHQLTWWSTYSHVPLIKLRITDWTVSQNRYNKITGYNDVMMGRVADYHFVNCTSNKISTLITRIIHYFSLQCGLKVRQQWIKTHFTHTVKKILFLIVWVKCVFTHC